jgi:hypothetical protein
MDILAVPGPSEPEDANAEADASDHDGRKSPLWDGHIVVGGQFAVVAWRDRDYVDSAEEFATDHAEERQLHCMSAYAVKARKRSTDASGTLIHPMYPLEHNWIKRQEQVEYPVNESHVHAHSQDDRLGIQKPQRSRQVLLEEFSKVDFDFFLLGVDAPVACSSAELGGFVDEDYGRVGFFEEEDFER